MMEDQSESASMEWEDWRGGECLLPSLVGKFYEQNSYTDVTFVLQDGSTVQVDTGNLQEICRKCAGNIDSYQHCTQFDGCSS